MIPNFLSGQGPLFNEKLFITRPNLPSIEEITPKMEVMLRKQWVTNFGDFHNELADKLKEALNVKYVILCCNATIGLFLLLKALKLKGKVITTPFTFPATIHSIYMAGMTPLFCDIDPDAYTLDPACAERSIDPSVSAILSVNVFGNVSDVDSLEDLGRKNNIPVLYDSAHSFLSYYKEKPVGGFGAAEVFSFHATKLFTTLEGGAITTNDEGLFKKLKLLINFGIQDEEHVVDVGLNAKMSEMNAIFGIAGLDKMKKTIEKLSVLNEVYKVRLKEIPGVKFQKIRDGCVNNKQYMSVEIIPEEFGLDRDTVHHVLKFDNVITRKYFFPSGHTYECYKNMDFVKGLKLPNTEKIASRILCLPMYFRLNVSDAEKVCDLIRSVHDNRSKIINKLSRKV